MSRTRDWIFTLNNPESYEEDDLKNSKHTYLIYQHERGAEGTPHLQGYVRFPNPLTMDGVKRHLKSFRYHLETRRGSHDEAINYASKEDTRVKGPYESGTRPSQGKRNDITALIESVKEGKSDAELLEEHPVTYFKYYRNVDRIRTTAIRKKKVKPFVVCLYGPTGSGKSRLVWDNYDEEDVYSVMSSSSGTQYYDGYYSQKVALFDDYYGNLKATEFLKITDRYPYRVNTKGSTAPWHPEIIIFTSNVHPQEWYNRCPEAVQQAIARRFDKIYHIDY